MSATAESLRNLRTVNKARIKRASALARQQMNRLDAQALAELDAIYRQAASDLSAIIESYAGPDGNIRIQTMQQLLSQANQRLGQLNQLRDQMLNNNMQQAASIGVSPYVGDMADNELVRIADEAVQFALIFIAADGLQLSDRVWRINNHASEIVSNAITSAIVQGQSASEAANNLIQRGLPVPADIANKINQGNAQNIARVVARDLTNSGSPRASALRLFRTELNRAHGEAYMQGGENLPEFGGWRFLLSPRHPEVDICDMHASVNRYGLGPGVYPDRKRTPWPAHPNTLSYIEIVFVDEISKQDRSGKTNRIDWLKQQPPGVQQGVLNSRKKRSALSRGLLRENEITTPWRVLKTRYQRRGINTDELNDAPPQNAARRDTPAGVPVSTAIQALGYKSVTASVLDTIDRIHGDGQLPSIPVKSSQAKKRFGVFRYIPANLRPVDIKISRIGDHKELTLAHEIGHFIDMAGLPGDGFTSRKHPLMQSWREAVNNSQAIQQLQALKKQRTVRILDMDIPLDRKYINHLLREEEIWARSYAQYIATRGQNTLMRQQLKRMQQRRRNAALDYAEQWHDDDFQPIAEQIDKLFAELGWIQQG